MGGSNHRGLLPAGETALFVLADNDLEKRMAPDELFSSLRALSRKADVLAATDIAEGIRLEFQKEGKLG